MVHGERSSKGDNGEEGVTPRREVVILFAGGPRWELVQQWKRVFLALDACTGRGVRTTK